MEQRSNTSVNSSTSASNLAEHATHSLTSCCCPAHIPATTKWVERIAARWRRLSPQQQVYAVIAGAVLSAALWQLLTFGVVLLERLLLGSLIAAEEVLLSVLMVAVGVVSVPCYRQKCRAAEYKPSSSHVEPSSSLVHTGGHVIGLLARATIRQLEHPCIIS